MQQQAQTGERAVMLAHVVMAHLPGKAKRHTSPDGIASGGALVSRGSASIGATQHNGFWTRLKKGVNTSMYSAKTMLHSYLKTEES